MDLSVKVDASAVERGLRGFEKQIPYTLSVAINTTARQVNKYARQKLSTQFTLRNNRVKSGIRTNYSSKRQYPDIHAEVGSLDGFMADHAEDGRGGKSERPGWHGVPHPKTSKVPSINIRGSGNKGRKTPSKQPQSLKAKGQAGHSKPYFVMTPGNMAQKSAKDGKERGILFQKTVTKKRKITRRGGQSFEGRVYKKYPIRAVYVITDKGTKIPKSWKLHKQASWVVSKQWSKNAMKALEGTYASIYERSKR